MSARTELDNIRARTQAATEGTWKARGLELSTVILDGSNKVLATLGDPLSGYNWKAAEFIAHARTDVPRLLAALNAVQAECNATDTETGEPLQADLVDRIRAAITGALETPKEEA